MRELKFRGICLASGNMVFGGGIDTQRDTPRIFNQGVVYYVDAKTVCQFISDHWEEVEVAGSVHQNKGLLK